MIQLLYTPFTDDVDRYLPDLAGDIARKNGSCKKILHLTPTLILYRHRKKYLKYYSNRKGISSEQIETYEFYQWAREWLYKTLNKKPLSRLETYIILKRAINKVFPERLEWEQVASNLLDLFLLFRSIKMDQYKIKKLSDHVSWSQVCEVYRCFSNLMEDNLDFQSMLIESIKDQTFDEYECLVLDGPFLFFNHLHETLINRFEELNKQVVFIVPFDRNGKVNRAYRVIQKVYSNYVPEEKWKRIGFTSYGFSSFLEQAPLILFENKSSYCDESISICQFQSREQEIAHIIQDIKEKLQRRKISLNKIAIISSQSRKLRPMVHEIAEQSGLPYLTEQRPVTYISTMDWIRILYQSKIDIKKLEKDTYFNIDMFKRILNSNWYPESKESILYFERIAVFFEETFSLEDWSDQFNRLLQISKEIDRKKYRYHPLISVEDKDLELWKGIVDGLLQYQRKIFEVESKPIGEHVKLLLGIIKELNNKIERDTKEITYEDEVISRIEQLSQQVSYDADVYISAYEFAEILSHLLYDEPEYDIENIEQFGNNKQEKLTVTSLHNIAFQDYQYIYLTQFTQDQYPVLVKHEWPMNSDLLAKIISETTRLSIKDGFQFEKLCADRDRYYFYLAFLSAKQSLQISFSDSESGEKRYPSHFLYDVAQSMGISEDGKLTKLLDRLEIENILKRKFDYLEIRRDYQDDLAEVEEKSLVIPDSISFSDLAVYRLCPQRYYFATLNPKANVFATRFQLAFYFARKVYQRTIRLIIDDYKGSEITTNNYSDIILTAIPEKVRKAVQIERKYFPVGEELIHHAIYYARLYSKNFFKHIYGSKGVTNRKVKLTDQFVEDRTYRITVDNKEVSIDIPDYVRVSVQGKLRSYHLDYKDPFLYATGLNNEFNDWYKGVLSYLRNDQTKASKKLNQLFNDMLAKPITKSASEMCKYCPFMVECKEKDNNQNW